MNIKLLKNSLIEWIEKYFEVVTAITTQKLTLGKGGDLDSCSDSFIAIAMSFSSCCFGVKAKSLENISDRLGAG